MGFLSQKVERSDLQAGDHIYSWRTPVYAYSHHGIYIGDNKVVHFTQDQSTSPNSSFTSFSSVPDCVETCFYIGDNKVVHFTQDQSTSRNSSFTSFSSVPDAVETCLDFSDLRCGERGSGVIMSCLNCFLGKKGSLHRYEYGVGGVALVTKFRGGKCSTAKSDLPEEVIHKAMHLLQNGFGKYDVFTNNCEQFALYCKTGLIYGPKGSGGSGQVHSFIGVPASVNLSLPVRIFFANPVVRGAAAVGKYALGRYTADLGVRSDVVKIKVEELVAFHRILSSVDQEDAGLLGSVTEAEDLAMVSSEEDAWKLESLAEIKVEDLAVSHRNLLSADQEGAGLFRSATKVKVEDLAASHHNILSADQEDAGLFGSATKVEDLARLLSAEEDAWKLQSVAEIEVGDVAALHRNILSADQEDAGLGTGPQPVKSPTPQSESTPAPSPRPSQPLETAFSDPPASSIPTGSQAKEKEIAVEPFRAREHFEAPRAEFPRAQEFAHSVHEALLDLPLAEEVDYASRSANLLRHQSEVMYKQFMLTEDLIKDRRIWLKEQEELIARVEKAESVNLRILKEKDQLQTSFLKRGVELDDAIKRHVDLKAKYDQLRSSRALSEAKLLTEVASLQSQVSEQRNINLELLANIKELREEKDATGVVDWEVATEMPEFEPVREVLYAMGVKSAKEAVLAKYPNLDLGFFETEEEEVEETTSEAAELGPEGKRTVEDESRTSKAAEAVLVVEAEGLFRREREVTLARRHRRWVVNQNW